MTQTWIPAVVWFFVFAPPSVLILRKTGLSLFWAVPTVVPLFGAAVLIWVVALLPWPALSAQKGPR